MSKKASLLPDTKQYKLEFPYNALTLAQVRSIKGRKFVDKKPASYWVVPATKKNKERLLSWGFTFDASETPRQQKKIKFDSLPLVKKELKKRLAFDTRLYQTEGVAWLVDNDCTGILGDDMGLGKTIQAIGALSLFPERRPALIICPSSVKYNWKEEIEKWLVNKEQVTVVGINDPVPTDGILIMGYNTISKTVTCSQCSGEKIVDVGCLGDKKCPMCKGKGKLTSARPELKHLQFPIVIVDECHNIKNATTQRTMAARDLIRRIPHRILMSGTPVENKPIEFFTNLNLVAPTIFRDKFQYGLRYCDGRKGFWGWEFNGSSNLDELHDVIDGNMVLRRLKSEVLPQLPKKQRIVIPLEINNEREYALAENNIKKWAKQNLKNIDSVDRAEAIFQMEMLKQIAVQGKLNEAVGWIHNYLETEKKLVIFAIHRSVLKKLGVSLAQYNPLLITGATPSKKRHEYTHLFQTNDKNRVIIGGLKPAGVGLTMTAASSTCTIELGWNSSTHDQAEDRVNRIGQEASSINAFYLLARNTIEIDLAHMIDTKRAIASEIMDGQSVHYKELFIQLLERLADG